MARVMFYRRRVCPGSEAPDPPGSRAYFDGGYKPGPEVYAHAFYLHGKLIISQDSR